MCVCCFSRHAAAQNEMSALKKQLEDSHKTVGDKERNTYEAQEKFNMMLNSVRADHDKVDIAHFDFSSLFLPYCG